MASRIAGILLTFFMEENKASECLAGYTILSHPSPMIVAKGKYNRTGCRRRSVKKGFYYAKHVAAVATAR